jgi:hypothetical protein
VEASYWRIKFYASWLAGFVGAALAAFAGFDLVERFVHGQDERSIAANIYIVVLSTGMLIFIAVRQWSTIRKERYANITPTLHQLMHQIRDVNTFIRTREPTNGTPQDYQRFADDCKMFFGRILDQLNSIFTSITSTHCRASIKMVYGGGPLYVYTLARDQGSRQTCLQLDKRRVEQNLDPLTENVQFARLFDAGDESWHYFCNDLMTAKEFCSTSVAAYSPNYAKQLADHRSSWLPRKWPLPYRSTIACVIRQGPVDLIQNIVPEVLGFLTIDSESRNVFEPRWDVQIMFAVADALYGPIRAYLDAQNRAPAPP